MTHLQLVKPFDGGPLPDYPEHGGRPVTWRPWQPPLRVSHVVLECEVCGSEGDVWTSAGLVGPDPGEQFTVVERHTVVDGQTYGIQRQVRAWAIFQLAAFRCSSCGDTRIYDTGRSGCEWTEIDIERPVLW